MTRYYLNGKEVSESEFSEGGDERIREMLDSGRGPTLRTDSTFMEGRWNQFEKTPWLGEKYKKVATAHGVSTQGKTYYSQLARFPGDPEAWVSSRGEVQKICEQRGWGCSGAVNVKGQELAEAPKRVDLDDELVHDRVLDILDTVPEQDRPHVDVTDLKEQVRERIKPHWSK